VQVGAQITLIRCPPGGWWEGACDGVVGWFPSNYVVAPQGILFVMMVIPGSGEIVDIHGTEAILSAFSHLR